MNCLITFSSQYGSARRYAMWIGEALGCDVREVRSVTPDMLRHCDMLIHGGGLYAGGLKGLRRIRKLYPHLSGKPLVLFTCGLADPGDEKNVAHIEAGLAKALTPEMAARIRQFHFRGGIDYGKLNPVHRAMMAMLRKTMLQKGYDDLGEEDRLLLDTYGGKTDFSDRASIAPLVEYVKGCGISCDSPS